MMVIFYYSLNNRILSDSVAQAISGFSGFEDLQDVFYIHLYFLKLHFV
jgi:hypothetical protein